MDAYERHGRALLRKAERLLLSREDARDVVQGLFLDLLEDPGTSQDLPFLYRAVTNRCLTLLRDEKNRARLLREHDVVLRGQARRANLDLDDKVLGLDAVARLASELDEVEAQIFVAHFYDDMTQEEIAAQIGLSRKTVGRKLDHVKERARALVSGAEVGDA